MIFNIFSEPVAGEMQKSKSTTSVVQAQGSRLVANTKKIWKSRSKSQTRAVPSATSTWIPQGNCQWSNVAGRVVTLNDTTLLHLTEVERRVLQKVALAKLQALNLGVPVRIPTEVVASETKVKRRPHLLTKRVRAKTITLTDSKGLKDEKAKSDSGGMVFGIPLSQCVESERSARAKERLSEDEPGLRHKPHHGSRTSCASLVDAQKGSSDSLICPTVSMPGLLDTLSMGSSTLGLDLQGAGAGGVPNIVAACLSHLQTHGLHTLGIFRVSSSMKRVRQLREEFDSGKDMAMEAELCPHDIATLLKDYLRELPDSLLCKDLYAAFIQTQRIRHRQLQHEAVQHLLQLLPVPNRDTLWALLTFLAEVARNCEDHTDSDGEWVVGNKMDSTNLATLFAPNILRPFKKSKDELNAESAEERSNAINVVRSLIENHHPLYQVSAKLLDEVYVEMMDSNPEALDQIMQRRDLATDETEDLEAEASVEEQLSRVSREVEVVMTTTEESGSRQVWSRQAFTHETAGMGGPDVEMKPRRERGRERVSRRRRDEAGRRRLDSDQSTSSRRTSSTSHPDDTTDDPMPGEEGDGEGVVTARLKIPMPASAFGLTDDADIPFIEDPERHYTLFGMMRTNVKASQGDSAVGSSVSPPHTVSSLSSGGVFSSPPSPWTSSPPTSPDHTTAHHPTAYLPDKRTPPDPQQRVTIQRVTIKSTGEVHQVQQTYQRQESSSAQERRPSRTKDSPYLRPGPGSGDQLAKSASSSAVAYERTIPVTREGERATLDRPITPSISSIGGAVLRSKTADIERMLKIQSAKQTKKSTGVVSSEEEKKIKRKYGDGRTVTRTIPVETTEVSSASRATEQRRSSNVVVYKRREIISSEPKERKGFFN